MQAAKDKTYNMKYYIHSTKNLFQEDTKARKQKQLQYEQQKQQIIDIVMCCYKNSTEKHFAGHKNSHQLQLQKMWCHYVYIQLFFFFFGDLTVDLQHIRLSLIVNSLCSTRVYLLRSDFFVFLFLVLSFKKVIQICTTSIFRLEDGCGPFL